MPQKLIICWAPPPPDPDTIAKEPHQTWKSVLSGRLLSWGGSYVAFLAMGPKLTDKISKKFGDWATKGWKSIRPHSDTHAVKRWADIAAFDALFTVITAVATYGISRTVASKDEENHPLGDAVYDANLFCAHHTQTYV